MKKENNNETYNEINNEKSLTDLFNQLKSMNFQKYKAFKQNLCQVEDLTDLLKLSPEIKLILFYENLLENALLFKNLFPEKESDEVIKKILKQAEDFYNIILLPFLKRNEAIANSEKEKIKKLKEFIQELDIDLED